MPTETTTKKTARTRKTVVSLVTSDSQKNIPADKSLISIADFLSDLMTKTGQLKEEVEKSQKEIIETKANWEKEKKEHEKQVSERDKEVELLRRREEEEYQYQLKMERKRIEDEFSEKKAMWEKELRDKKEEIESDKRELTDLREKVAGFESEIVNVIKETQTNITKEMETGFSTEKKLREQEIKADKEI